MFQIAKAFRILTPGNDDDVDEEKKITTIWRRRWSDNEIETVAVQRHERVATEALTLELIMLLISAGEGPLECEKLQP